MKKRMGMITFLLTTAVFASSIAVMAEASDTSEEHVHSYQLQEDSYESTDTEGGFRHYKCTDEECGDEYSYETDPLVYTENPKTGAAISMTTAVNPYLPTYERMPDNEMHVFWSREDEEWRVYTTGSHDSYEEDRWCGDDVIAWSAPVYDLTDWRYEGTLRDGGWYFACDFAYDLQTDQAIMLAFPFFGNQDEYNFWVNGKSTPDSYFDTPMVEGGIPGADDTMIWDPAIYIEDDGSFYYVGDQTDEAKHTQLTKLNASRTGIQWSVNVQMAEGEPESSGYNPNNYEANTLDYIEEFGVYVIQYSYTDESQESYHPLAYIYTADTDLQNAKWHWGGIIGDNGGFYQKNLETGEIEYSGEASYSWDNNHGSLVKINGEWYLSNHRHTGETTASRQGFLEKVTMSYEDGKLIIKPTEYTSSIGDSIDAYETWQAATACYLTPAKFYSGTDEDGNYNRVAYIESLKYDENNNGFVYDDPDYAAHRTPIVGIEDGVTVGFKYLDFGEDDTDLLLKLLVSQDTDYVNGTMDVYLDAPSEEKGGVKIGSIDFDQESIAALEVEATASNDTEWKTISAAMDQSVSGVHGVYFVFSSEETGKICKLDEYAFVKAE